MHHPLDPHDGDQRFRQFQSHPAVPTPTHTHSVPLFRMGKFAPLMPTSARQDRPPQVQPGRLGERGRVSRSALFYAAHLAQEDGPSDLRPSCRWNRGPPGMLRRPVLSELNDKLRARSVSYAWMCPPWARAVVEPDSSVTNRHDLEPPSAAPVGLYAYLVTNAFCPHSVFPFPVSAWPAQANLSFPTFLSRSLVLFLFLFWSHPWWA